MLNRALAFVVTGPIGFFVAGAIDVLAATALGLVWLWRSRVRSGS